MRVYVSDQARRHELQAALRAADCVSMPVGDYGLEVRHQSAPADERHALIELRFFLKAWQCTRPNVGMKLVL